MKTNIWPVQDAKARFSEMLEAASKYGPQTVTKRGVETAILVPIDEWNRVRDNRNPSLKELLLSPEARFDFESLIPRRGKHVRRKPPVSFE